MKKIGFKIILIILVFVFCSFSKSGVFLYELITKPAIEIYDNKIIVIALNSLEKTPLIVYKIEMSIDANNKIIKLKGFKVAKKSIKNRFELKIKRQSKKQLEKFEFIWVDPDKNEYKITTIIN